MSETIVRDARELTVRRVSESTEVLVCSLGGEEVGWSALCPLDPASAYELTRQLALYVAAPHRRHGIADWLLLQTAGFARSAGIQTLIAFPPVKSPWIANWLCRHGFERRGSAPRVLSRSADRSDAAVLQLSLEARDA